MTETIVIDRRVFVSWPQQRRDDWYSWLAEHDLDPEDIKEFDITDGVVTATVYVKDDDGKKQIERDEQTAALLPVTKRVVVSGRSPTPLY